MSELPQPPAYDPDAQYIRGIPYPLPRGERILWQGGPEFFTLAKDVFRVHIFAAYFAVLFVAQGWYIGATRGLDAAADVLLPLTIAGMFVSGFMLSFAWLTERNTWFAITSRRVVMRTGIALTVTINIPLKVITAANVRRRPDGSGELAFPIDESARLSLFQLWPFWKPWAINRPVAQFRAIRPIDAPAKALQQALEAWNANEAAA